MPTILNLGCGIIVSPEFTNVDIVSAAPYVIRHDLRNPLPFGDNEFDVVYHSHVLEHFSARKGRWLLRECLRVLRPGGVVRVVVPDLEDWANAYLQQLQAARAGEPGAGERHSWMLIELLDQMVRHGNGGEMLLHWLRRNVPAEDLVIERMGWEYQHVRGSLTTSPLYGSALLDSDEELTGVYDPAKVGAFRLGGEAHLWNYDELSLQRVLTEAGFTAITRQSATTSQVQQLIAAGLDFDSAATVRKPHSLYMEAQKPPQAGATAAAGFEDLLGKAITLFRAGNLGMALHLLNRLSAEFPPHAEVLYGRALVLQKSGCIPQARQMLEQVLRLDPAHDRAGAILASLPAAP